MDDIAHHQKIGGKTHLLNHFQFMLKPFDHRLAQIVAVTAPGPLIGLFPQHLRRLQILLHPARAA